MSLTMGNLRASYTRSELLKSVRDQYSSLAKGDQKGSQIGAPHYDIYVKDQAEKPDSVRFSIPGMTHNTQLDAQFKPGLWQSSFFTVTRQEEGEINIKQAVFPRPWSPDRTIEVTELRLSRGHTEPNCTSIQLGMGDLGRSWTVDSFPESKDYPRDTVQRMLKQAESLMPDGELAFLSGPMDQSGKLAAWSGPSPL